MGSIRPRGRFARVLLDLCVTLPLLVLTTGSAHHAARVLWVSAHRSVFKVSPLNGTPELELADLPQVQALAVDPTRDHVWVYSHKHLWAYDAQGHALVNEDLLHDFHGDAPADMVVDGNAGTLWIGIHRKLYRFDLTGKLQATLDLKRDIRGLTLDPTRSHLWVAEEHALLVLDHTGATVFTVALDHRPDVLAYDANLDQVWVVSGHTVTRYGASGNQVFTAKVPVDLNDYIAPDGQGGLWVAGDHTLGYLDESGNLAFSLTPFSDDRDQDHDTDQVRRIVALVADPLLHTAWVADGRYLKQYAPDSTLKQTVDIRSFIASGHGGMGDCQDHQGDHREHADCGGGRQWWSNFWYGRRGIHHVVLYVDTIPPTVSITSPANGLYTNHPQLPLVLTYSDVGSGVDPTSIKVTNDGVAIPETCVPNSQATGATCTPNSPLPDGEYDLKVTVADYAGNVSKPASVYFTVDTIPPTITLTSPQKPADVDQADVTITGMLSEAGTLTINGANVPLSATFGFSDPVALVSGSNAFTFVATDLAGNVTTLTENFVYNPVPSAPNNKLITIADPVNGAASVTGQAGAVGAGDQVVVTNTRTGQSVTVTANANGGFTATLAAQWGDPITLVAQNPSDTEDQSSPTQSQAGTIPPSPASIAPPLTPTGETPFAQATAFLYTGTNPIQVGVAGGTMQAYRVAVIRGEVEDTSGKPLAGVIISVLHHPEYGYTVSRTDGSFDLAVNGGQSYTLKYSKAGYLLVERNVKAPWRDYAWAPTVALTQPAADVGLLQFDYAAPQFLSGLPVTDADGTRTASLFVPAGTSAMMTLPDGSKVPLASAHLRITEFTVGPQGQQAMPAQLPAYSTYTYALDYQMDEAVAQNAKQIAFSNTVYGYVTNFLKFPVGVVIPSGWYDYDSGEWIPSDSGLVIQILGTATNGEAVVDVDGNGQPATAAELSTLGFTSAELTSLTRQYPAGTSLWRVPLKHFSTFDWNPTGVAVNQAGLSGGTPYKLPQTPQNPCKPGCIVGAAHQTLGEVIPLTGTSTTLQYDSADVQSTEAAGRTLVIPLTGAPNNDCFGQSCYTGLVDVELDVYVAGQRIVLNFPPQPKQTYTFVWNGQDAYGREVYGSVPVNVTIRYITDISYVLFHPPEVFPPTDFGYPEWFANGRLSYTRASQTVAVDNNFGPFYLTHSVQGQGIALGWDLSSDAWYDFVRGVLHHGDGSTRSVGTLSPLVVPLVPSVHDYTTMAIGADGTTYLAGGTTSIVALPTGGTAPQPFVTLDPGAQIDELRMGSGGTLYAFDKAAGTIYAISRTGVVTKAVTNLQGARAFALLPGGAFVVSECGQLVEVGLDGTQTPIAGKGCNAKGDSGDGGLALEASIDPLSVAADQDGDIYFAQSNPTTANTAIRRVSGADGTITSVPLIPGVQAPYPRTIGQLVVKSDGGIIASGQGIYFINSAGMVTAETGSGNVIAAATLPSSGAPAASVGLEPLDFAIAPGGTVEVLDQRYGLVVLRSALPTDYSNEYDIASRDGSVVYRFDELGRLQQVLNSLNGDALETYLHNTSGQLTGITDAFGRTLKIDRDGAGHSTEIVSPDGQVTQLSVDPYGNLTSITDPAGDKWILGYQGTGFLTSFTDPRGETEHYTYDAIGRLIQVQEPDGGGWQINRQDTGPSSYNVTLTSGEGRVTQYTYNPNNVRYSCDYTFDGTFTQCFATDLFTTAPDGTITAESDPTWGAETDTVMPDGTQTSTNFMPDPRFGIMAPLSNGSIAIASNNPVDNLTSGFLVQRSVSLGSGGLLDVANLTQTTYINGESYTDVYDGANSTWTDTTPAGRSVVTQVNAIGQPLQVTIPGLAPLGYSYDAAGRLTGLSQGSGSDVRDTTFSYYPGGPSKGFLESVTDPIGRAVSYGYDGAGRVTTETLPDGEQILFGYDADGNLTSVTPPGRPAHAFGYTSVNDVADYTPPSVSGVSATATQYSYNLDRQLTGIALPDGESVSLGYDSGGRLSTITMPTGTYQYSYTPSTGQLASVTSPDSESLAYSWNGFLNTGDTWSGPVAGSVSRTYDDNFRVTSLTPSGNAGGSSASGTVIDYRHDTDGLIILAGALTVSHDPQNGLVTGTTLGNLVSTAKYDAFGEPSSESVGNPASQVTVQASVSPASVTDPVLQVTGTLPTGDTLVIEDTPASGSPTSQSYPVGSNGQITGNFTLLSGANSLVLNVENGGGGVIGNTQTSVSYSPVQPVGYRISALEGVDGAGDLYFGQTNSAAGTPVQYALAAGSGTPTTPASLQTAAQLAPAPDGSVYFVDGNDVLWHEVNGQNAQVADLASQVNRVNSLTVTPAGRVYFSSNNDIYSVSATGQIAVVGALTGCSPQPLSAVRAATGIRPNIIALGYNITLHSSAYGLTGGCQGSTGEAVYLIQADGSSAVLASTVTSYPQYALSPSGEVCFIDGSGQGINCQNPGGSTQTFAANTPVLDLEYDPTGRLYYLGNDATVRGDQNIYLVSGQSATALIQDQAPPPPVQGTLTVTATANTTTLYSVNYTRDNDGRITQKTETVNGVTTIWGYGYDQEGRLDSVSDNGVVLDTYGYDPNGNRVSVNRQTVATYDDQDRLLTYGGNSYSYNANGELTGETLPTGTLRYAYNALGDLTDVTLGSKQIHYLYDGQNRLVGKEVNGKLTEGFLYDGQLEPVAELDGSGNIVEQFVYGTRPNVPDYILTAGQAYRVISNQVGSPVLIVNASTGAIAEQISYDAWGNITADSNPGFQPFGFAGGLYDPDTGFVHFGARDYDPLTGRWMSKDPVLFDGNETSLYGYAGNDPINLFDSTGLKCTTVPMLVTAYVDKGPGADWNYYKHRGPSGKPGSVGPGTIAVANTTPPPYPFGSKVTVRNANGTIAYQGTVHDTGAGWNAQHHNVPPANWIDIWLPSRQVALTFGAQWKNVTVCTPDTKRKGKCH